MPTPKAPRTALRKRLDLTRTLDPSAQVRECVEYLENPQILVMEFEDSFQTAEIFDNREESFWAQGQTDLPKRRWVDHVVQRLIESGDIGVALSPPYTFQYMARQIVPLWSSEGFTYDDATERRKGVGCIDYVGVIKEEEPRPVMGVIEPEEDVAPYVSFLRAITCLSEVCTDAQMERANRFLFKGAISGRPPIDLHIVGVDRDPTGADHELVQLTRDLAHQFAVLLREEGQFPNLLRNIALLSLRSDGFDGTLLPVWSV
jgi:hypothetical protein